MDSLVMNIAIFAFHVLDRSYMIFGCNLDFLNISAGKSQPTISESRSPTSSVNKSDPGSPEKTPPRGEARPEPALRLRSTSSSSSPGGPVSPKPPVPQGAKPALAARPTIPQKPRTTSSSRSIGTSEWHFLLLDDTAMVTLCLLSIFFLWAFMTNKTKFVSCWFCPQTRAQIHPAVAACRRRSQLSLPH